MAATKNLVMDQGATFSANIQYLDTNKNPISLAGFNVRSKMRTSYDSPNAITLTATITNASTGNVNLYLDYANTSLVHYGRYVYDTEAYSGNIVIRIQEGAITVTPGVSGNSVGSILKQTLNSLVNGSYTVSLDANGVLTLPGAAIINGNASISGNVIGSYFIGNGALLTNVIPIANPTLNILKIDGGVHEKFQALSNVTGTVTHDCSLGHVIFHTSPNANWTANFTNLNLSNTYATAVTLVISQGVTGYYPNVVQISGVSQTINWQGNATPTLSTNRTDVVTFSIINNSGTYTVLGQLTGF